MSREQLSAFEVPVTLGVGHHFAGNSDGLDLRFEGAVFSAAEERRWPGWERPGLTALTIRREAPKG